MWFSNLRLYRLTKPLDLDPETLEEALAGHAFRPCGTLDHFSYGWVAPLGRHGTALSHGAAGRVMLCARKEEKLLPPAVVREIVAERAEAIEQEQGRPLRRKERDELKAQVVDELLPRAFSRSRLTFAYIAPQEHLVVVNATSAKAAEELLSHLRNTLGSLPVVPLAPRTSPVAVMTRWLTEGAVPNGITLEDECELREKGEDGGIVRCRRQDLTAEEIGAHLAAGKQVTRLAIGWEERLTCVVDQELTIKRLRFSDALIEDQGESEMEDPAAAFDADFTLMAGELARFVPRLLELFGGESERGGDD